MLDPCNPAAAMSIDAAGSPRPVLLLRRLMLEYATLA